MNQRWRGGRDTYRPAGEVIDTARFEVARIPDDRTAKTFVMTHHYSGSYPAARFRFGLYDRGELVGVAVFSHPSNPLALRPLPGEPLSGVELGRFVLLDSVPGNGETWFLARCFEDLRREGLAGVVSFSDPYPRTSAAGAIVFAGHVGTIYQAHNAVYLGPARPDTMRLLPDGRTLHNRALAKLRVRDQGWRYVLAQLAHHAGEDPPKDDDVDAWVADRLPRLTRKVRRPGNHKYVWALDKRVRRVLPPSQPYPKLHDLARAA